MIKSVKFTNDYKLGKKTIFKKGHEIVFSPRYNILVGDQGTGKSTLIELVRSAIENFNDIKKYKRRAGAKHEAAEKTIKIEVELPEGKKKQKLRALDMEKDVSRTKGYFDWGSPLGGMFQVGAMWQSHGEANLEGIITLLKGTKKKPVDSKGALIILDEPDAALSPKWALKVIDFLSSMIFDHGCQLIASMHNPMIINLFKEVYSLEVNKWVTPAEFMEVHLGEQARVIEISEKLGGLQ